MPKGRPIQKNDPGSVAEQLLGRGDDKRSTKTFIEDGALATSLGVLQGLPEMIINVARHLHAEEFDLKHEEVTADVILETYPEAYEIISLHQRIVEHKGSQSGYLVDRYTSSDRRETMEGKSEEKKSSGEVSKGKWQ